MLVQPVSHPTFLSASLLSVDVWAGTDWTASEYEHINIIHHGVDNALIHASVQFPTISHHLSVTSGHSGTKRDRSDGVRSPWSCITVATRVSPRCSDGGDADCRRLFACDD
jgi:hypothetical protein